MRRLISKTWVMNLNLPAEGHRHRPLPPPGQGRVRWTHRDGNGSDGTLISFSMTPPPHCPNSSGKTLWKYHQRAVSAFGEERSSTCSAQLRKPYGRKPRKWGTKP